MVGWEGGGLENNQVCVKGSWLIMSMMVHVLDVDGFYSLWYSEILTITSLWPVFIKTFWVGQIGLYQYVLHITLYIEILVVSHFGESIFLIPPFTCTQINWISPLWNIIYSLHKYINFSSWEKWINAIDKYI